MGGAGWRRHRVLVSVLVLMGAGVVATAVTLGGRDPDRVPPPRVCEIAPAGGEVAIVAAIDSCPNGSTIRFPANQEYHQANRILVRDRRDLVIDGNGSTFITSADASTPNDGPNGNWLILRGFNITLKNMTSVGAFNVPGPRDLARASAAPGASESNPSYGLYGVDTVHLTDVRALRAWGDGVTIAPDEYVDGSTPDYTTNVFINRMEVETVFRHCWAPTSGTNIWIENSNCRDAWYAGIDAELDTIRQPFAGHHYLRNTFDGFFHYGILVPVAGELTRDIEITGNRFLSGPDNICHPTILVGAYPESNPRIFTEVATVGNEIPTRAVAIQYDHVNKGKITGNVIRRLGGPTETPYGSCGTDRAIAVTNTANVTVEANVGP